MTCFLYILFCALRDLVVRLQSWVIPVDALVHVQIHSVVQNFWLGLRPQHPQPVSRWPADYHPSPPRMDLRDSSTRRLIYSNQDFAEDVCRPNIVDDHKAMPSTFDSMLKAAWSDKMSKGFFRYSLGDLETRILPGRLGYVAQLNVQRGIQRRKPEEILNIKQNYNPEQFNFNKIKPEEVIFEMTKKQSHHFDGRELGRIMVIVNVSPLEFGHCLFIPEPRRCFPQILTPFAIRTGIEAVLLSSDPGFRVGFNSLGAFASVNHLHLHGYYLDQELQIECAAIRPVIPEKGLYCLSDFPVGFLFYTELDNLDNVVRAISRVTDYLLEGNQAHNLFFTRGCPPGDTHRGSRRGVRIAVWPRIPCFGAKEESAFNVALCELAGHLPFKNKQEYDSSTEDSVKSVIQKYLLPHEEFLQLEKQITACLRMDTRFMANTDKDGSKGEPK